MNDVNSPAGSNGSTPTVPPPGPNPAVPTNPTPATPVPQPTAPTSPAPAPPSIPTTDTVTPPTQSPAPTPTIPTTLAAAPTTSTLPQNPVGAETESQSDTDQGSALSSIAGGFTAILGAIFSWIIFPVAVVLILHNFVFQAYHVLGTSMMPTLHDSDYLIVSKVGYTEALMGRLFGKNDQYIPARGQIIVFHYPKDPTKVFVKRVVGLPGDHIVIKNGTVTIYDKAHPSGFDPDTGYESPDTQTLIDTNEIVQPGELFVMGDNRTPGGSFDSREWGELPSSYIIGNAVLRLLPLDEIRIL